MSELTITERVAAGASWLDDHKPGWIEAIDLDRLELHSVCDCILGQTFGDYADAPEIGSYTQGGWERRAALGFTSSVPPWERDMSEPEWEALTDAWCVYITSARRSIASGGES